MDKSINKNEVVFYKSINYSFTPCFLENSFTTFKSINNIFYLIFSNKNKSIISYDIIDNKKINEIKNAHKMYITNFRYYYDKINKRDLILSVSAYNNNIKLWNINNLECLLDLKNINKTGFLNSASFLNEDNKIYLITSNFYYNSSEHIKIFNLNGDLIKRINDSTEKIFFIDSYFDKNNSKNYILTGNFGYVKSYDYIENKIYHKYEDNNKRLHYCLIIKYNENEDIIKIIESCVDKYIRIWNFHSAELLDKIEVSNRGLNSIILNNNNHLLVGCDDKTIKILELKTKIIKDLFKLNNICITIKFINSPFGDILLFQGLENNPIELYIINL